MVESTCTTVQKNTTKDTIKLGSNKTDSGFYNDVKKQRNINVSLLDNYNFYLENKCARVFV